MLHWLLNSFIQDASVSPESTCSAEIYTGDVCRSALQSLQSCIPDRCGSTEVYIPSVGLQNEIEQRLASLVGGLQLVNPSPECQAAIVPFLCSYYFQLCDSSNTLHPPSLQDCVLIANQTCAREFQTAVTVLGRDNLPNCETLPSTTALQLECDGERTCILMNVIYYSRQYLIILCLIQMLSLSRY